MAAPVTPIRQRTQYTCGAASLSMALKALGCTMCEEDKVNEVMGAAPMRGAAWEQIAAAANHYGCRSTLVVPSTLAQVKGWTDAGKPVLIGWNPEERPWSHASLVFDVTESFVFVADPNCPDPAQTVREVSHADFYKKWSEEWNGYKVRRPAMLIDREVDGDGRQVMASAKRGLAKAKKASILTQPLALRHDYGYIYDLSKDTSRLPGDVAITAGEGMSGNNHAADSDGSYMSVGYLKALAAKSHHLLDHIHYDTPLPDWAEAKIGVAANAINAVFDYFEFRGDEDQEETMSLESQYTLLPQAVTAKFEEGKSVDVPKYLEEHGNPEAAKEWVEQNEANRDKFKTAGVVDKIRGGDRVTIMTPQGQQVSGTAVMKGPSGWVLNMGGKYGRPGIATEENIVKVVPTKNPRPTFRAASQEVMATMMGRMAVGDIPADVERYVKEIEKSNPDYDEAQTWATAWSIYCKYKEPGSEHCSMPASDYFTKQACGEDDFEGWGETLMADWEEGSVISPPTSGPGTPYTEMWGSDTPDGVGNVLKRADEVDPLMAGLEFMAEGCPDNLDEAGCEEWEANTEKYKDVVKDLHKAAAEALKLADSFKVAKPLRERLTDRQRKLAAEIESCLADESVMAEGLDDACWEGYEAVGMKVQGGKEVPNCVPVGKQANNLPTTVQGWLEWED